MIESFVIEQFGQTAGFDSFFFSFSGKVKICFASVLFFFFKSDFYVNRKLKN